MSKNQSQQHETNNFKIILFNALKILPVTINPKSNQLNQQIGENRKKQACGNFK